MTAHTGARTFPSARARAGEGRHRRALLLGVTALLLLSLTPVVGPHLFGAAHGWVFGQPLTGVDHVGPLCLIAAHLLLAPVHAGLHGLVTAGVAYALWDRARAWRRARRALAPLQATTPAPGDAFWSAARQAGVPPERLRIVAGLPNPAFTAGWVRPVVYAARELADGPRRLAPAELAAVLAHEGRHLRRRDPLRYTALRAVAHTLFWIPALRGLTDDVAAEAEIRADDEAAARTDPLTLASALIALAAWALPARSSSDVAVGGHAVGFVRDRASHPDLLERRVRRLAGQDTAPASRVTRRSLGGAVLALAVAWASGIVDVHALPRDLPRGGAASPAAALHCLHRHASAWAHLFCRAGTHGGWITPGGSDCPHRAGTAAR